MNDLVALLRPQNLAAKFGLKQFQNEGDFRMLPNGRPVSLQPHGMDVHVHTLNFLKSIRGDLGLPKELSDDFLKESAQIVDSVFFCATQ